MNEPQPLFNRKAIRPIECLSEGWELVKDNYWLLMGICELGHLLSQFVPLVLTGPMLCGIYFCMRRQQRREEIKFEMLFKGFDHILQSLIATAIMFIPLILIGVAYFVFIFVMVLSTAPAGSAPGPNAGLPFLVGVGAFYLLFFLVTIAIQVLSLFAYPLIVNRKVTGTEALRISIRAATSNIGSATGLVLLILLLDVIGSFACCIGTFFVLPIHFAAVAVAYRKVFPEEGMAPLPPVEGPEGDYGPVPGTDEG